MAKKKKSNKSNKKKNYSNKSKNYSSNSQKKNYSSKNNSSQPNKKSNVSNNNSHKPKVNNPPKTSTSKKVETNKTENINKEENIELQETASLSLSPSDHKLNKKIIKKIRHDLHKNVTIITILIILLILLMIIVFYNILNDPFKKEINVEIGSKQVTISDFFDRKNIKNSEIVTDLDTIDFNKPGDYNIEIKHGKKIYKSVMHLVDTTAPKVVFKDVEAFTDYEFNPRDFIESIDELTDVTVEALEEPKIDKIGNYKVTIVVKDSSNNETREERTLFIGFMEATHHLELGNKLTKEDILYDIDYKEYISQKDLDYINKQGIGEYEISATIDDKTYTTKVIVEDTKGPELTLKNVTIYNDKTNGLSVNSFIKKVSDSSKYTTTLKSDIPYGKVGKHQITIEAKDEYNNVTTKTATLSVVKDTTGPTFSGLSDITINKNSTYDYRKGVKAVDAKDGKVDFSVNTSALKVNQAGVYYISYVALDKSGNKTIKKRKISVNPSQSDINDKVKSVAKKIGNSVKEVNKYVNSHMHYINNWGGKYPVWYGLINWKGNCYVYANVLKALLEAKGYKTKLTWVRDKSHYWVMVYDGGKWWHSDAQCDNGLSKGTDEDMLICTGGREWDREAWPEA